MITCNFTKQNIYNFFLIKSTQQELKVCLRSRQDLLVTVLIFGTVVLAAAAVINAKTTKTVLVGKSKLARRASEKYGSKPETRILASSSKQKQFYKI